jgi:hypothetical protein
MTDAPGEEPQPETTDSARLLARGVAIELAFPKEALGLGGHGLVDRECHVKFDYRAVEMLEADFGSMEAFAELLRKGSKGPLLRVVRLALTAGLVHEDLNADQVASALSLNDLETYADVVGKAFEQAFPASQNGAQRGEGRGAKSASPGRPASISRSSPAGSRRRNSGG